MAGYKYETHLHTSEASACAILGGQEQALRCKEAGYEGIIVTDHFFNGNSCIKRDLAWEDRIELFCRGYENARLMGEKIGLSVFFGWEANYNGTEFLIYGPDKEWLKSHPDMLSWTIEEQYRRVKEAGGMVVHAHPFRISPYLNEMRFFPEYADAVEAVNISNRLEKCDRLALAYARKYDKRTTAGSDSHGRGEGWGGMIFNHKLKDIRDFIDSVMSGEYELIQRKA